MTIHITWAALWILPMIGLVFMFGGSVKQTREAPTPTHRAAGIAICFCYVAAAYACFLQL